MYGCDLVVLWTRCIYHLKLNFLKAASLDKETQFSSNLDFNAVTFNGLPVTLKDLKQQIMVQENLKATNCVLQIINEQTHEEYTNDEAHIPKHCSVIVRRLPNRVKPGGRKFTVDHSVVGASKPTDSSPPMSLAQLAKTANLVDANASEEDKIRAMMLQSNHEYDPIHYSKKAVGPPPAHYTCYRCGQAGHYIQQCPLLMVQDNSAVRPKPIRIIKGIPQSFMLRAEPGTQGAMLTSTGEYVIPAIDAEAYAQGKKEHYPFVQHDQSSSEDDSDPIPEELLCPVCNDLMTDAVIIPCCGSSYCDDCIRTALLDSEEHVCFTCKQSDVSPDDLIANKFLRQVIEKISIGGRCVYKQTKRAALPPTSPRLSSPAAPQSELHTTLDPPAAAPTPPHAAAVDSPDVPPARSPVTDQHSPRRSSSQGEPPPPGEMDPEPTVTRSPESNPEIGSHGYNLSVLGHPPPTRPPHPSGHQSRPHPSHRGGGRQWERSYRGRGDHPPTHLHAAPPPGPAPPVYPSPSLYPPPPQAFPPPYASGLIHPPPIGYPPQPIYAPGPPGLNPPWIPPGVQPPLAHLGPLLGPSYYRSQSNSLSTFYHSPHTRSRSSSRARIYCNSPSRPHSPSHGRSFPSSRYSRHHRPSDGHSQSKSFTQFQDDWEKERNHRLEKEYADWCNNYYGNRHPSLHHRGHRKKERKRDRRSPFPRDYSPQGRRRRKSACTHRTR